MVTKDHLLLTDRECFLGSIRNDGSCMRWDGHTAAQSCWLWEHCTTFTVCLKAVLTFFFYDQFVISEAFTSSSTLFENPQVFQNLFCLLHQQLRHTSIASLISSLCLENLHFHKVCLSLHIHLCHHHLVAFKAFSCHLA